MRFILKNFRFSSLGTKFLLTTTGMILATVVVSFLFLERHIQNQVEANVSEGLRGTWNVFHSIQGQGYEYLTSQALVIADDPKFFASIADLDPSTAYREGEVFRELIKADLFLVTDKDGMLLVEIGEPDKRTLDSGYRSLIAQSLKGTVSSGLVEKKGKICQAVSVPINLFGEVFGTLTTGNFIDDRLAATIKEMTDNEVLFFRGEQLVAASLTMVKRELFQKEFSPENLMGRLQTTPGHSKEGNFTFEGEKSIFLTDYLGDTEDLAAVSFVMFRSLDAIVDPFMANITRFMITISLLGVAISFVLSLFISDNLTASLRQLEEASKRVARGNYDTLVKINARDETAEVGRAFNEMSHSLKRHIEELKIVHAGLLESERLAAVGKVSAAVVHDFKNPMAIMNLALEALERKQDDQVSRGNYIQKIKQQMDRILTMTQEILEFSRGETRLKLDFWNPGEALEELTSSLSHIYLKSNIQLVFKNSFHGTIQADQNRLMRVFNNMLTNAKEAMTTGGRIEMHVTEEDGMVAVRVSDNGPGIPDEVRGRLFHPFVSYGKANGTGLGLAISKRIVEQHGGRIDFESYTGRGTTFNIQLPKKVQISVDKTNEGKNFQGEHNEQAYTSVGVSVGSHQTTLGGRKS